ncbi:MAG: (Fe-S)-binding protein [Desulfatiglandales bacterium]
MEKPKEVTLFIQCLVDGLYPEVGEAMVRVLEKLGISMNYPADQTCCGQPTFNAGFRKEARVAARRFIEIFEQSSIIVCPSGSCVHMVRNHYPELFKEEPHWLERAENIGRKTFELTEYLVDVLGVEDVGARFEGQVTYHDSCHLNRYLGISEQPRRLIRNVRGLRFIEMEDSAKCCGFGGEFSFRFPDISTAILEDKVRNVIQSGAEVVIGCDMGCLMNIQGMLNRRKAPVKTMHIAQLLAG